MLEDYTPIPPARAGCVISHLLTEIEPPCPCERDTITLTGKDHNGRTVKIVILNAEVWIDADRTVLDAIESGLCAKHAQRHECNS
jgi:hypothetical protein